MIINQQGRRKRSVRSERKFGFEEKRDLDPIIDKESSNYRYQRQSFQTEGPRMTRR